MVKTIRNRLDRIRIISAFYAGGDYSLNSSPGQLIAKHISKLHARRSKEKHVR